MHQPKDSQSADQVENVEDDNKCVHLVLFHVVISVMSELNVLFLLRSQVVVVEDSVKIVVVCQLRVSKLHEEGHYNQEVGCYRASSRIPVNYFLYLFLFLFELSTFWLFLKAILDLVVYFKL